MIILLLGVLCLLQTLLAFLSSSSFFLSFYILLSLRLHTISLIFRILNAGSLISTQQDEEERK